MTVGDSSVNTIIKALQKLESMGYTSITYVAGSDRVDDFKNLITKYNGKDYNFKNIEIVRLRFSRQQKKYETPP